MQPFSRTLTFGIVVLALVVPVSSLSAQNLDVAKQEGKVVVYQQTLVGNLQPTLKSAFEKKYPGITVEWVTDTPAQVTNRFLSDYEKGVKSADVIAQGQAPLFDILQRPESLAKYVPKDTGWLSPDLKDRDERWASQAIVLYVIGYNTNLVQKAEAPKSYMDLLYQKWTGKMGASDPKSAQAVTQVWKPWRSSSGRTS